MEDQCKIEKEDLQQQITSIRDNHLAHIVSDIGEIKVGMAGHKTDLDWLKKAWWIIAGASISSLMAALMNMLISYSK